MANLHLVTGHAGSGHVTAEDQASLNAVIFGSGCYVLNRGSNFSANIITNNLIRVSDGDLIFQGRHVRANEGTYVDLTIENGTVDMKRNDLIVARYTKDSSTGVEECNLVVIKGESVSGDPADPEYTTGDLITNHDLVADMPLYRVPLDGLNVQALVPLFAVGGLNVVFADGSITSAKIADSAVTTTKINNSAVVTAKIADSAVTNDKISGVSASKVLSGTFPGQIVANATAVATVGTKQVRNIVISTSSSTAIENGDILCVYS